MKSRSFSDPAGIGILFSCGFLALVLQTLLFRGFLTVFEGNELGLSVFFCSWLFWAAVGAWLGRRSWKCWDVLLAHFSFAPLLFLPACLVQAAWISSARALAGVPAYEVFPFARMVPVAWIGNAPVGLISGLLFTLACSRVARTQALPVARVFIVESLGSFAGGLAVTALLYRGLGVTGIVLTAVLIAGLACWPACAGAGKRIWGSVPVLLSLLALATGLNGHLDHTLNQNRWGRALPEDAYLGRFATPHGTYLYGDYRGQFHVVAWETVADTIPNAEMASEIVAVHVAQCPDARNILVFGSGGFGLCRQLLRLPHIEQVTWLDADPDYPRELLTVLPNYCRVTDERFLIPGTDVRRHLEYADPRYDLVILNLPDVTTLAMNRFMTLDFIATLQNHLAPGGVLSVRVAGGDNVMGSERVNLGASMYRQLSLRFESVAIKPGDESWLFARSGDLPDQGPAVLRDRFASVPGAKEMYPVEALPGLYPPDRVMFQREAYEHAMAADDRDLLLNTDQEPRALLHSLLFAAREAGVGQRNLERWERFALGGAPVLPMVLLLYLLLRLVYLRTARRHNDTPGEGGFDWIMLVAGAGGAGMALNILLMCLYQSQHGVLFLQVGLVSALFMLGLACGGHAAERWVTRPGTDLRVCLATIAASHLLLLAVVHKSSTGVDEWGFMLLFLLAGATCGLYFPVAAAALRQMQIPDRIAGGSLAAGDDVGGAIGGSLVGLIFLPMFGVGYALAMQATLLLVVFVPLALPRYRDGVHTRGDGRALAYIACGVSVSCLGTSLWLNRVDEPNLERRLEAAARVMVPDAEFSWTANHLQSGDTYCISSHDFADGVYGYGGPIILAMLLDADAILQDVRILDSHETPAYLDDVVPWLPSLHGRHLLEPPDTIDGVTGATLTSDAILATVDRAGQRFAAARLGKGSMNDVGRTVDDRLLLFVGLVLTGLGLRRAPNRTIRNAFLLVVVVTAGFWLNIQYSLAQVLTLLGGEIPPPGLNLGFFTVVGIPVLVLLVGNLYCGYLCPFGALQELIGELLPRRLQFAPDLGLWKHGRRVKYFILFLLTLMFAFTLHPDIANVDPLVFAFNRQHGLLGGFLIGSVLGLSLIYRRFWCRNLCPVGGFLSLLNGAQLLRRFLPPVAYRACSFGLTGKHDLDCLVCDRCRRMTPPERRALQPPPIHTSLRRNTLFAAMVLICGLAVLQRAGEAWRATTIAPSGTAQVTAGTPRDLDLRRLHWLIEQGRLSDHEARFAEPLE